MPQNVREPEIVQDIEPVVYQAGATLEAGGYTFLINIKGSEGAVARYLDFWPLDIQMVHKEEFCDRLWEWEEAAEEFQDDQEAESSYETESMEIEIDLADSSEWPDDYVLLLVEDPWVGEDRCKSYRCRGPLGGCWARTYNCIPGRGDVALELRGGGASNYSDSDLGGDGVNESVYAESQSPRMWTVRVWGKELSKFSLRCAFGTIPC
jgi:hypothetical protein